MVTRADVARLAGVSPSTVTYVLTGQRPTTRATRERVQRAIDALGYRPNRHASLLAARSVRTVGVLFRMQRSGIDANDLEYIEGLRASVESLGIQVFVPVGRRTSAVDALETLVQSGALDAAVLMDVAPDDEREQYLLNEKVPTVLIGTSHRVDGAPGVDADFKQMADLGVRHLVELGHRRILFLMRDIRADRSNAYMAQSQSVRLAARRYGVEAVFRACPDNVLAGAREVGASGLAEGCTAVVSNSPSALEGVIAAAWARGLSLPRDLSLVSVGLTVARTPTGDLVTEVGVDRPALGRRAGGLLLQSLEDDSIRGITLVDPRLIDHGSTAPPAP
ncbi:LacI family DNA-binding transcriptional regulator [Actinomyces sp. MRS3W]|uniref:LacI family DNA-binding transcriptional regulator n=1 Tax=Actinomyces sp. MRS3W TaxID=2800796 RepID=UPI0028FD3760|nr:LacI family DNA-binding transcriptional regulator [Actinomyces sp. MRS3W]MDU0347591.1 LacI family DNA-binding transcriptional regulator [Actinomyces sp. MRS3W]